MEKRSYDVFIDAKGLNCPLPLIKTRQALMVMGPGDTVCVLATDPGAARDFKMFTEASGHRLLRQQQEDGVHLFVIQKKAPADDDEGIDGLA